MAQNHIAGRWWVKGYMRRCKNGKSIYIRPKIVRRKTIKAPKPTTTCVQGGNA